MYTFWHPLHANYLQYNFNIQLQAYHTTYS